MSLIKSIAGNEICDQTCRNAVNNIYIGGVNIAKGTMDMSRFSYGWNVAPDGGTVTTFTPKEPTLSNFKGLKWTGYNNGNSGLYLNTISVLKCPELRIGETYTISAWASVDISSASFSGGAMCENQQYISGMTSVNTGWTRIWVTFIAKTKSFNSCFYVATTSGYVWLCGIKLERGNKPTDWTPAPEDICSMRDDGNGNVTIGIF